ncbi:MAG: sigma-70 family RNA polymerase sigma factor, partial [Defluviitaleaceae bacterium]|nr:sigma-70 family RNA polymerase sigma factor [Defluviitaleaceae bacterium]
MCQKFCDNKQDAEEVVQDTFFIAYQKAESLRAETLMGYLRKIAINACYRKRRSTPQAPLPDAESYIDTREEYDVDFLPEEYLHIKEQRNELLRIVMSLPKMQWETVYLYYYAMYSVEEIARLHNCSVSNVCKTLRNARQSIKNHLEGKRKKKLPAGTLPLKLGMASLAAFLVVEEQLFAAVYLPAAAPCWTAAGAYTTVALSTASASTPVLGYFAAACAVVVFAASAVVYYTLAIDQMSAYTMPPEVIVPYITEPPQPDDPAPAEVIHVETTQPPPVTE